MLIKSKVGVWNKPVVKTRRYILWTPQHRAETVEETFAAGTRQFYGPCQLSLTFVRILLPIDVWELFNGTFSVDLSNSC